MIKKGNARANGLIQEKICVHAQMNALYSVLRPCLRACVHACVRASVVEMSRRVVLRFCLCIKEIFKGLGEKRLNYREILWLRCACVCVCVCILSTLSLLPFKRLTFNLANSHTIRPQSFRQTDPPQTSFLSTDMINTRSTQSFSRTNTHKHHHAHYWTPTAAARQQA